VSQAARIRRGPAPKRRTEAAAKGKAAARATTRRAESLASHLPISAAWRERLVRWLTLGAALAVIGALLVIFQVPRLALEGLGRLTASAGLEVHHVETTGFRQMDPRPVTDIALAHQANRTPMLLVDLEDIRARLLQIGWVEDAQVSRRLPDTLAIRITERVPVAIWQHRGKLSLIDPDGIVLSPVRLDAMPDLPLVIGPSANRQAASLDRLLGGAPTLKPMLAGATWIGGRRWDLRFQSGEVLALPEGEARAQAALVRFARLDGQVGLLGQGLVRFDMRLPGKQMTIRMTREPGKRIDLGEKAT